MEADHGSLTRALIAKMREAKRAGKKSGGPAGPGGRLTTFAGGMARLPERLADRLGDRLLLDHPVLSLSRDGQGFVARHRRTARSRPTPCSCVCRHRPPRTRGRPCAPDAVAPLSGITDRPHRRGHARIRRRERLWAAGSGFRLPGAPRRGRGSSRHPLLPRHFPGQAPPGPSFCAPWSAAPASPRRQSSTTTPSWPSAVGLVAGLRRRSRTRQGVDRALGTRDLTVHGGPPRSGRGRRRSRRPHGHRSRPDHPTAGCRSTTASSRREPPRNASHGGSRLLEFSVRILNFEFHLGHSTPEDPCALRTRNSELKTR